MANKNIYERYRVEKIMGERKRRRRECIFKTDNDGI